MSFGLIILLFAVLVIGLAVFAVIVVTGKSGKVLQVQKYQQRWLVIESKLKHDEPASFQVAVFEADKLLDMALKERGFKGATMGERMKAANNEWTNADHVWGAHKIRNKLAHETDVHMTYEIAARSLAAFRRALTDLGAL